jgi:hypothetical protein
MRRAIVASHVRSSIDSSEEMIGSQWIIGSSRLAADPARELLG